MGPWNPTHEVEMGSVPLPGSTPSASAPPVHRHGAQAHKHAHTLDPIPGEQELSQHLAVPTPESQLALVKAQ